MPYAAWQRRNGVLPGARRLYATADTATMGVASLIQETCTLHELIEAADQQTYRAKRAGKNRVFVV